VARLEFEPESVLAVRDPSAHDVQVVATSDLARELHEARRLVHREVSQNLDAIEKRVAHVVNPKAA